jgi:hypothetical protein
MSQLKYINYVNLLKSNNIILYDHDYRISYNNIKTYYNKTDMTGGGNGNNMNELFNNMDKLIDVLNLSLSVNPQNLFFLANN